MIRFCAPCCNCVTPRILTVIYPQLKLSLATLCEMLFRLLIGSPLFLIALFVVLGAKHGELKKMPFEFEPSGPNDALSARTRPLRCGNRVFIQNQGGRHPRKWNKVGTVVEALDFDQYNVKVGGSGRITRRNRRFLLLMSDVAESQQTSTTNSAPRHETHFQHPPPRPPTLLMKSHLRP